MRKEVCLILCCYLIKLVYCHEGPHDQLDVGKLSMSLQIFSEQVYKNLASRTQEKNLAFSPLSLHTALSLLALGSKKGSKTFIEFSQVLSKGGYLHLGNDTTFLQPYRTLFKEYKGKLAFGNHIWLGKDITLLPSYVDAIKGTYVEVDNIDFSAPSAVNDINFWVNNITNGKIPRIVNQLDQNAECVIVNALYFKEKWTLPFTSLERDDEFQVSDKLSVNVSMMYRQGYDIKFGNYNENFDVIRLPYEDSDFEMVIILPNEYSLQDIENEIIGDGNLNKLLQEKVKYLPRDSELYLRMPKFDLSTEIKATEVFQDLGLKSVFTEESELGEMTQSEKLRVSRILHKAAVTVDENGTEAAASTFIDLVPLSITSPIKNVIVNKPFLFILQDSHYRIPLIMGRVVNPSISK